MSKVVSGGQTGVDRAALDAALTHGIECGGWCPKGRRAEDGPIDSRYPLQETPESTYGQRTAWNVRDSDGTLILYTPPLSGGTLRTRVCADQMGKPFLLIDLTTCGKCAAILEWIRNCGVETLNVAGPRESGQPGVYDLSFRVLDKVFATLT